MHRCIGQFFVSVASLFITGEILASEIRLTSPLSHNHSGDSLLIDLWGQHQVASVVFSLLLVAMLGLAIFALTRNRILLEQQRLASELSSRLQNNLRATRVGTWVWNIETGDVKVDQRWAEILGYALDELPAINIQGWIDLTHEDDLPDKSMLLHRHFDGEHEYYEADFRMLHKAGHWVWIHDSGQVTEWSGDGFPLVMYGTYTDISEQRSEQEQLQKLSRAVEQSSSIVVITDLQANIEFVNPAFTSITGYTLQDVVGKNPRLLQTGFLDANYYERIWDDLSTQKMWQGELHNKRKDGSSYWSRAVISPVKDTAGEITHYVSVAEDITLQRQSAQELKASEQRFDLAMSVVNEGIWDWDKESGVMFFDSRCYTMAGYDPGEFPGTIREWKNRIHPDDVQLTFDAAEAHVFGERDAYDVSFRFRRKDGDYMWIRARGRNVANAEKNETQRFVGTHTDITDQKRIELELAAGQQKYQGLVQDIGEDFVIYSHDGLSGEITFISDGVFSVFGLSREVILEKVWSEAIAWHEDDVVLAQHHIAQFFRNESEYAHIDMRFTHPDGTEHTIHVASHPVRDSAGKIISIDGIVADITERKRAEEQLRLAASVFEHSQECIIITNADNYIIDATPACTRLTGYSRQQLMGAKSNLFSSGVHDARFYRQLWTRLESGQDWRGMFRNKHKNGHLYWEESSISPVKNPTGDVTHYVAIKRDVTEKETYLTALRDAKQEAQAANRAKSDFLANISHEIRTPMNAILGFSELSLHDGLDPESRSYIENIQKAVQTMLALIDDVLDFSKIEAGKLELESIPFDLNEELLFVSSLMQDAASRKGLVLNFEIPKTDGAALYVVGDPLRLKQVLINLIGNAIKFSGEGEITVLVTCVEQSATEVRMEFDVCDSGIGISREEQKHLFQAFSQADTSTTRKYGGTGLGLSISKQLVNSMNGELNLESEAGIGSTFYFELIMAVAEIEKIKVPERQAAITGLASTRVLVVDDDVLNQQVVCGLLQRHHLLVDVVSSGHDALTQLEASEYDLVLMDIQMPVMDGFETTRLIRKKFSQKALPVFALTANALPEMREKCLQAGMNDCVSKPIDSQLLLGKISQLLGKSSKIDVKMAMERLGIDRIEYLEFFKIFIAAHEQDLTVLRHALEAGNLVDAQRIAHTLSGLASTVGAMSLSRLALQLEQALGLFGDTGTANRSGDLSQLLDETALALKSTISTNFSGLEATSNDSDVIE